MAASAYHRSHRLAFINQRHPAPCLLVEGLFIIMAPQNRLGAAYGGQIEPQAEMGSDSQVARVRDTLAINHDQIRLLAQVIKGAQNAWRFTKREQARYVGHTHRLLVNMPLQYLQLWIREKDHSRPRHTVLLVDQIGRAHV